MENRRQFIKKFAGAFSGISFFSGFFSPALKHLFGAGTMDKNSAKSRKIQVTPLKSFGVMGKSDIEVNQEKWRLEIHDKEGGKLEYSYDDILSLPSVERKIVLLCPGFFENHGLWKGFSLGRILKEEGLDKGVKKIEISGLNGKKQKSAKFPLKHILDDQVFLAYGVNREKLPVRNGYPLRVVGDYYPGDDWIKYVNKVILL